MSALLLLAAGKLHWTEEIRHMLRQGLAAASDGWVVFGFAAQAVFASRFVLQWIESERRRASYIPIGFWYLSIVGTLMLAAYAVHRRDPVFIAGQSLNTFIYIRNLMLIHRANRGSPAAPAAGGDGPS